VMQMRPYKWDTLSIKIRIPEGLRDKYMLKGDYFNWTITPDMKSDGTTYLSPWRALLSEIIEANGFDRPVYFADGFREVDLAGLLPFTMDCGIVKRLMPFETKGTRLALNSKVIATVLFDNENLKDFKDVEIYDFPGRSQILIHYYLAYLHLASYYKREGNGKEVSKIVEFIRSKVTSKLLESDRYIDWMSKN